MNTVIKALILTGTLLGFAHADTFTAAQDPWPPFVQEESKPGLSVALARAALEHEGHSMEMSIMPWARSIDQVKNGNIDILVAAWHTEERTAYLRYSEPYIENQVKFIKRPDDDFEYTGMESLTGKSVGIVKGYGYGDEFLTADHFSRPETPTLVSNIRKLLSGRIDLTLEDEIVARSLMTKAGIDPDSVVFLDTPLSSNALHIATGLANSKGEEVIDAFNRGYAAIKANGTMAKLMAEYGVD